MIGNDWDNELKVIWNSPNFNKFYQNVLKLYDKEPIFPPKKDIFNALKLTPYKDVKVPKVYVIMKDGCNCRSGSLSW